ncbi:2-hydroxyacid dehydrogenase [Halomonas lysinitropha]|uniref:Glyoxylate/hydroxypyruvate reductase B n=1 Tax=Halomonas lysinitropha TaxID=2607506 RepID=A0A5K1I2T8_9GAMM|nr:2-hydroxyacid dehydrogenase [Halomonas lysinitropha]VVZ94313.1 Glyoxylate/hydroxypyruvate reductase B [Halomonas lysinitropha]
MKDIEILVPVPMREMITDQLDETFILHRLWEQTDPESYLDEVAPRIRGLAAGGHRAIDAALLDRLPALEIVSCFGVGYDHVDAAYAGKKGVIVTNTPDVLTDEVADAAVGLLIATLRQFPQADRFVREGKWLEGAFPLTPSLRERTIGMVGLGRIGHAIARRLEAFGVDVIYHSRTPKQNVAYPHYPSLTEMARDADVLVVTTPGGPGTQHLIDSAVLEALGSRGVLINIARGSVVDEQALITALQNETILTAGLDVFENEPEVPQALIDMEHVVLLPHVGSGSVHTRDAMGQLVVDNLRSWFAGKGPLTPVVETPYPPTSR